MEKKVTRKEANIYVNSSGATTDRPLSSSSSSKLAAQGKNLIIGNSTYSIPDPEALAAKYGVETNASISHAKNNAMMEGYEVEIQQKNQQIQQLEGAVYSMKSKIEEKNRKIEHLCVLLEALEPIPGMNPAKYQELLQNQIAEGLVDLRDSKIVNLAKKSHNLTMLLNKERTTNSQLTTEVQEWKKRHENILEEMEKLRLLVQQKNETKVYNRSHLIGNSSSITTTPTKNGDETHTIEDSSQVIQSLQKQVKDAHRQVEEMKRKMKEIQDENQKLTATLKKEIGEGVTLDQAVDSGWRGRAQQIVMLKAKVLSVIGYPLLCGVITDLSLL